MFAWNGIGMRCSNTVFYVYLKFSQKSGKFSSAALFVVTFLWLILFSLISVVVVVLENWPRDNFFKQNNKICF